MLYNQTREREEVEQSHIMEYQEFNKHWDETLMKIEEQDAEAMKELESRHVRQLEENR